MRRDIRTPFARWACFRCRRQTRGRDDLLMRYVRLEEFNREARKFGSQRQQSETRAVAIGLENLARTAGFRDPQRLQWAMEQRAVADLARGPLV